MGQRTDRPNRPSSDTSDNFGQHRARSELLRLAERFRVAMRDSSRDGRRQPLEPAPWKPLRAPAVMQSTPGLRPASQCLFSTIRTRRRVHRIRPGPPAGAEPFELLPAVHAPSAEHDRQRNRNRGWPTSTRRIMSTAPINPCSAPVNMNATTALIQLSQKCRLSL